MNTSPAFALRLFGSPSLAAPDGAPLWGRATQRHRLALLAMLARSPEAALSRDVLMAHLWPESDLDQARNLLKVSVYVLRQALGDGAILSVGDGLRLAFDVVDVDTLAFEGALEAGDHEAAVTLYKGPFLEGFFLKDASEFAHWLDRERARLGDAYAKALESLAEGAKARGDPVASTKWWKMRAAHDPFDTRVAFELMSALVAAGSRAGALQHARVHAALLRGELGIEPTGEFQRFVDRLRSEPEVVPTAVASLTLAAPELVQAVDDRPSGPGPVKEVVEGPPPTVVDPRRRGRRVTPTRRTWPALAAAAALMLLGSLALYRSWSRDVASDPSTIAEDIAKAVVREMGGRPGDPVVARPDRPLTANVIAWELYRQAGQPEVLRSDSAAREALALVRRAADLDPTFAGAHSGLARLYLRVGPPEDPYMRRMDRFTLARRHASMAVELDRSFVEGHATLGIADMSLYLFDEAEAHLREAVALDPHDSQAREWLVQLYVWMGRFGDALDEAEWALASDPLSASARGELARALLVNGRCDEALAELEHLDGLDPPLLRAGPIAAQCHAQRGMWDEAVADVADGLDRSGSHGKASWAYFLAGAGRRDEALDVLGDLLETNRRTGEDAFWVAMAYAGLGQIDDAFTWLDRAVDDRSLTYEIREPRFSDLQADPRFRALLARLNVAEHI